jgi:hypothetical protein
LEAQLALLEQQLLLWLKQELLQELVLLQVQELNHHHHRHHRKVLVLEQRLSPEEELSPELGQLQPPEQLLPSPLPSMT